MLLWICSLFVGLKTFYKKIPTGFVVVCDSSIQGHIDGKEESIHDGDDDLWEEWENDKTDYGYGEDFTSDHDSDSIDHVELDDGALKSGLKASNHSKEFQRHLKKFQDSDHGRDHTTHAFSPRASTVMGERAYFTSSDSWWKMLDQSDCLLQSLICQKCCRRSCLC